MVEALNKGCKGYYRGNTAHGRHYSPYNMRDYDDTVPDGYILNETLTSMLNPLDMHFHFVCLVAAKYLGREKNFLPHRETKQEQASAGPFRHGLDAEVDKLHNCCRQGQGGHGSRIISIGNCPQ